MSRLPSARLAFTLLAAPLAFAAVGCAPTRNDVPVATPAPVVVDPAPTGCDAPAAQRFVGRMLDDAVRDEARTAAGARTVRVIHPGMAVTMDYREDRLNIELDDAGRIVRIGCG